MKNIVKNRPLQIFVVALLVIVYSCFFVAGETEQYIITRFGKPVRKPITTAGLHFKFPLIEKATKLDKRILEWDGYPNQVPTRDKKYIIVDTTARWKIVDPLKFLQTVRTERAAQSRLDDIIDSGTREAISRHDLVEVVRNTNEILQLKDESELDLAEQGEERLALDKVKVGRDKIVHMILIQSEPTIQEYGIELIDVRIKRLNYEKSVQAKVFERMISERKRIAEKLRSEGLGKKAEIEGKMNRELNKIESEAYKTAQEIMGKAEAESTAIYANAYKKDPDFFGFYSTLQTYQNTLDDKVTLFMSSNGEFFDILNK